MSGSFQRPGPACSASPTCLSRIYVIVCFQSANLSWQERAKQGAPGHFLRRGECGKESGNEQRALLAGRGGFRAVYLDPVDAGGGRTGAAAHKVGEADLGYAVQVGIVHARPLGHRFDVE